MTRLLRRIKHRLEVTAGGRGDGGRDRALHERGIGHGDLPGKIFWVGQEGADGEHRAAEVRQDQHAGPGVGKPERALDLSDAGPEARLTSPDRSAVAMVTVPPPTCPARSAVPSASEALCETRTIPTLAAMADALS
jgi:hypothetical protein